MLEGNAMVVKKHASSSNLEVVLVVPTNWWQVKRYEDRVGGREEFVIDLIIDLISLLSQIGLVTSRPMSLWEGDIQYN
jgi:hypothetical protein